MSSGRSPTYGEESRQPFKVVIPNGELAQIKEWVREYPSIETGGDLFGLWSTANTAVVQLVLGPGENSRRTSMSYYQDTKYLAKAGSALTEKYGLCHIGEWHSHHTLGLAQPSDGDENTVWTNMPNNGFKRFIVFIANMDRKMKNRKSKVGVSLPVGLGCFLFEVQDMKSWKPYAMLQGSFDVIKGQSPYRQLQLETVKKGAELIHNNHEIAVELVQSESARHECSNILLYNKDEEFGGEGLEEQASNHAHQQDLIILVGSAKKFNGKDMWQTMEDHEKTFFIRLEKELNGKLAQEINEVSVSFRAIVPKLGQLACRLVWEQQQNYVLKFYLSGSASDFNEIRFSCSHHADPVQVVKEEVKKHVTAAVDHFIAETSRTTEPFMAVNTKQQQQKQEREKPATQVARDVPETNV
ncbi:uncharacterized protein LOC134182522 [Corticium candelabrum]|uniref:uncharacterized protein LOC134182522 n=1 Tax=Corticium candelabrum TaxID=121492 RepID=UPI002E26337B|nr:uncharacterized protein LOC134182522 [Corticium candelabrum]